jgi:hypothetical protein
LRGMPRKFFEAPESLLRDYRRGVIAWLAAT